MKSKTHPGVYVPPPLIYVIFFFISVWLQRIYPLDNAWFHTTTAQVIAWLLVAAYLAFFLAALRQFRASHNTLVTIKPATSLETHGIYAFTRNPMYVSLLFLYSAMALFFGNWWTLLLLPLLVLCVQLYVIHKEEQYLQQAFGTQYEAYRKKVRRWL